MPPVKVTVMAVSADNSHSSRQFSGTVSSDESTTLSFSVAGTIEALYAKEGQKVTKGQLLGKVKNGEYLNAYNIAEAELAEAQDGYQRLKKLHDANALPDVKWVEMQQRLKQAENAAEMAKRTLDDANLISPASGTITRKMADVGQTVVPVQPIYEIVSTGNLVIEVPVSEAQIGGFDIGEPAKITIDSSDAAPLEGKVTYKSIVADPLTRTYSVKVDIPNKEGKILPGMIGNVEFIKDASGSSDFQGVALPSQAVLLNHDNRWFVWVVGDSIAHQRFVTADELTANGVIVKSGLNPGELVVVEGMQKVSNGTKVNPVER